MKNINIRKLSTYNKNNVSNDDINNITHVKENIIYICGNSLIVNFIIIEEFTKIDNKIMNSKFIDGFYYIDENDNFKIKDYNDNILKDGYYRINTDFNILNILNWNKTDYCMYYIKNGIIIKGSITGYYLDIFHKRISFVDEYCKCNDVPNNNIYYYNENNIYTAVNNIAVNIKDGVYNIICDKLNNANKRIYTFKNGVGSLNNNNYICLDTYEVFNNNRLIQTCKNGDMYVCSDYLLINICNVWKLVKYDNI